MAEKSWPHCSAGGLPAFDSAKHDFPWLKSHGHIAAYHSEEDKLDVDIIFPWLKSHGHIAASSPKSYLLVGSDLSMAEKSWPHCSINAIVLDHASLGTFHG